jgi:hypothetical protein
MLLIDPSGVSDSNAGDGRIIGWLKNLTLADL